MGKRPPQAHKDYPRLTSRRLGPSPEARSGSKGSLAPFLDTSRLCLSRASSAQTRNLPLRSLQPARQHRDRKAGRKRRRGELATPIKVVRLHFFLIIPPESTGPH